LQITLHVQIKPVIYAFNIIVTLLLIARVIVIDNDKAHLVFLFYYPALILLNSIVGLILKLFKKDSYKIYWQASIWMACLFIPIYIVLIMY
jgi:hypothetical protein